MRGAYATRSCIIDIVVVGFGCCRSSSSRKEGRCGGEIATDDDEPTNVGERIRRARSNEEEEGLGEV
jgi:hypothetical protein